MQDTHAAHAEASTVHIENSVLRPGMARAIPVENKSLKNIQISQFDKSVSRVVFELTESAHPNFKSRIAPGGILVEWFSQKKALVEKRAAFKNSFKIKSTV